MTSRVLRVALASVLAVLSGCSSVESSPGAWEVGSDTTHSYVSGSRKPIAIDAEGHDAPVAAAVAAVGRAQRPIQERAGELVGPTTDRAEDGAPLFPLPFTPDFTRGGGWGFAVGLGVEYENAYAGSDEYEVELDPVAVIQWRTGNHLFSWEGLELSWTTRLEDQWYVQVDLGLDGEREAGDSDEGRLDGLDERDDEFTGTTEVRYAFDGDWRNYVGSRISVGDSDFGVLGFLFVGHRFGSRQDGGGTEAFLYLTFADSNNLNRDFGVSPSEAVASGLAETDLDGGYRSAGLRIVDRRFVSDHFQVVSGLEFQYYDGDVRDSPIAREDFSVELELAVVFHF